MNQEARFDWFIPIRRQICSIGSAYFRELTGSLLTSLQRQDIKTHCLIWMTMISLLNGAQNFCKQTVNI